MADVLFLRPILVQAYPYIPLGSLPYIHSFIHFFFPSIFLDLPYSFQKLRMGDREVVLQRGGCLFSNHRLFNITMLSSNYAKGMAFLWFILVYL